MIIMMTASGIIKLPVAAARDSCYCDYRSTATYASDAREREQPNGSRCRIATATTGRTLSRISHPIYTRHYRRSHTRSTPDSITDLTPDLHPTLSQISHPIYTRLYHGSHTRSTPDSITDLTPDLHPTRSQISHPKLLYLNFQHSQDALVVMTSFRSVNVSSDSFSVQPFQHSGFFCLVPFLCWGFELASGQFWNRED